MTLLGSSSLAWELVREQRKATSQLVEDDKEQVPFGSEIVRLIALNRALQIWSLGSYLKPIPADELVFRIPTMSIKYESAKERSIQDATREILSAAELSDFEDRISRLSSDDFLELIAHIHSIGSYHLPEGHSPAIPQRVLGAYYTPREVSDYIAELTLHSMVKSLAKKNGFEFLKDDMMLVDPACGPGVFLLSAIRVCGRQFPDIPLHDVARMMRSNLYGVDLDKAALEIADISLTIMCREQVGDSRTTSLERTLREGNSLISLNGWNGLENHEGYFEEPKSRNSFEWRSQFPEVFDGRGGFDALLMNPPYERLKPNLAEFMRERLLSGSRKVHSDEFETYKTRLLEDLQYYRNSGEYRLANRHTLDTYRLFIERSLNLVKDGGVIGFIVPSTVLGDLSAEQLRRSILMENSIKIVNDFPEGNYLFPSVTQSVSIIALTRGGTTKKLRASFGLETVNDARRKSGYTIEVDRMPDSMRKSMVVPRLEKEGWQVLTKLHKNPILDSMEWLSNKRGEFDLTLHKRFISTKGARMLRGSHIGRYTLRAGRRRPVEYVDTASFHASIGSSSRIEDSRKPRIACQQISNRNQRWRLKFAPVNPGVVLANSCNYIVLTEGSHPKLLDYLLGVLNSELLNWRFDITSTNNHVSNRELSGLPLPRSPAPELVQRIGEIARECSRKERVYDAELEARIFRLYGIKQSSAKRILSTRGASKDELASVLSVLQGLMNR
ncbi:MAG: Eco57I restriction-modification methylase domain-containing protein [Candidatus Thorarchaeota archaeon]|jgi:Alw26I/Eco31I/Esp3I family type II restriction m6 adenine DNA methyltransferase